MKDEHEQAIREYPFLHLQIVPNGSFGVILLIPYAGEVLSCESIITRFGTHDLLNPRKGT